MCGSNISHMYIFGMYPIRNRGLALMSTLISRTTEDMFYSVGKAQRQKRCSDTPKPELLCLVDRQISGRVDLAI